MKFNTSFTRKGKIDGKMNFGFLGAFYRITEIYEFARRIVSQGFFDEDITISIKLNSLKDRVLLSDSLDWFVSDAKFATYDGPWLWEKTYSVTDLLNSSNSYSMDAFVDLMRMFNWENFSLNNLKDEQNKFLQRRGLF